MPEMYSFNDEMDQQGRPEGFGAVFVAFVGVVVVGLVLLFALPSDAQTFDRVKTEPPVCTVKCEPGRDGKNGRDGRDGKDGRDGVDAAVCPVVTYRPFDLGAHGLTLSVSAVVRDGCKVYVLAYSPAIRAAVLVDPLTGLAQVALNFTADVGDNARGPLTFDKVEVLDRNVFLWWHRGGVWSHQWPSGLGWWDLKSILVDNPRGGPAEALFRWRQQ